MKWIRQRRLPDKKSMQSAQQATRALLQQGDMQL